MTDFDPLPDWVTQTPSLPSLHTMPGGWAGSRIQLPSLPELGQFIDMLIDTFLGWVAKALGAIEIFGWKPFEDIAEWAAELKQFIDNVTAFLGNINIFSPDFDPAAAVAQFVNIMMIPLNLFAKLVGGLIPGGLIPGLDASKIVSGLFSINQIGDLQDTLDALDNAIANIPGAQELVDKIANALGVSGSGHSATDVYDALRAIPGSNIGSPISAGNVPGLDGSKITSGSIGQSFLDIVSIPGSIISGLLSGANIPILDQSKVSGLGAIAANASAAQGNWAAWLSGGSWADISDSVADFLGTKSDASAALSDATDAQVAAQATITQIFNRWGGNNAGSATQAQADAAMASAAATIAQHSAAISELQSILDDANGFRALVQFRQPETKVFDAAGAFTYTPPSWFTLGVDIVDGVQVGAGGGGDGSRPGDARGGDGGASTLVINGITHTAAGGLGGDSASLFGLGPGPTTYNDILYDGGGNQSLSGGVGRSPGGGGAAGYTATSDRFGGGAGVWDTLTTVPTSATITGTVGAGGSSGSGGIGPIGTAGGRGAAGVVHVRARAAMPGSFTAAGTLASVPIHRLNTGVAQTDEMTAVATWSRIPPGDAAGGHILIIRANAGFTSYVFLRVWTVGGVTNYELGKVSSGTKTVWKTGTVGDAIPFNAWSVTSDDAYTFTIAINGSGFDSYTDSTHSSLMGASYRSGGWGSSDSTAPGSITQFGLADSGTPSRITSASVATSQGTTSTSFTDLATTGPSVTLNVPLSGEITVDVSAWLQTAINSAIGAMSFVLSGANTLAADDSRAAGGRNPSGAAVIGTISRRVHLTGLNPGTTTVKAVYKTGGSGASTFFDRNIIVEPKP